LFADRTIERVIEQCQLQNTLYFLTDPFGLRVDDHAFFYDPLTGCLQSFLAFDLHQTKTAGTGDRQVGMVTIVRYSECMVQ
jgi:hypothetical protein